MNDRSGPDTEHPDTSTPDQTPDMSMDNAVSIRDAAVTAGVTEKTIRRWIKSGRLHAVKLGGQYRITIADLEAAQAANPDGDVHGVYPPSGYRVDAGHDFPWVDMSERPDSGHGQGDRVDTVDLAPLTDLIRDQNRRIEELSAATAFWQVRALQAEEQLKALTAGDDVPAEDPEPEPAGEAPESPQSDDPEPTGILAWWKRLWSR